MTDKFREKRNIVKKKEMISPPPRQKDSKKRETVLQNPCVCVNICDSHEPLEVILCRNRIATEYINHNIWVAFIISWIFLILGSFNIFIAAQECNNVFPQFFCGLRCDSEAKCSSAGCCWSGESCFIPTVSGYSYTESTTSEGVTTGILSLNSASLTYI